MVIVNLTIDSSVYTSNVYLVTGSHNRLEDTNTLVDVGRDITILDKIEAASTGIGKKKIAQVVLTHSHYDHANLLSTIKDRYQPEICAYSKYLPGVDRILSNRDILKFGDRSFEVIHIPGHSDDSVCFYCKEEHVLFAGDTPLIIHADGNYSEEFIRTLEKISQMPIETIYFGHGKPVHEDCNYQIQETIARIRPVYSESRGRQ